MGSGGIGIGEEFYNGQFKNHLGGSRRKRNNKKTKKHRKNKTKRIT
jgi:hypothetical protein